MKNIIYYLAQTTKELEFIIDKNQTICVVPLNLEILLYCIEKGINYLKLEKIINNNFHSKTLTLVNKLEKKISYGSIEYQSIRNELKSIIRFKIYNIAILLKILKFIGKNKIILSGWRGINPNLYKSNDNFYISQLIFDLNIKLNLEIKEKATKVIINQKKMYDYDIIFERNRLKNNSKIIFLNNTAYNFWRIIKEAKKNKYQIIFPIFKKMNFFKKGILYLYNVYPIFLKKKSKINKFEFYNKNKLRIIYKDIDISNIIKKTIDEKLYHLNDLLAKAKILKQFFRKQKISLAILNLLRGLDGCIAEILKKTPIPTVSVSHGTVSEYFNQVDKIYKYNILESVFAGDCKYTAISSKISLSAYKKFKIKSKPLMGNIIFSGLKNVRKTNNILFAVTLKDFENFQLHGVETHFEFINNLVTLSRLAKKNNLNFIINLHPSQHNQINRLMNIFPKLEFTKSKIESVLKKSFATISFSSSVIEDSITSNIPVILFDPHNRYKHCKAETKLNKTSRGIYYISNEEKLLKCINFIKDNIDKIETKKNNFNDDYKYNINNNLFSLIKT